MVVRASGAERWLMDYAILTKQKKDQRAAELLIMDPVYLTGFSNLKICPTLLRGSQRGLVTTLHYFTSLFYPQIRVCKISAPALFTL